MKMSKQHQPHNEADQVHLALEECFTEFLREGKRDTRMSGLGRVE